MRAFRKCSRILILCLLAVSVFVPVFLLSYRLKLNGSDALKDRIKDLSIIKHRSEAHSLSAIEQEGEGVKEPPLLLYKDDTPNSEVKHGFLEMTNVDEARNAANDAVSSENNANRNDTNGSGQQRSQEEPAVSRARKELHKEKVQPTRVARSRPRIVDEKIKEMKDQVIRAKAYLNLTPSNKSSHIVKELRLRVKEVERATSQSTKDSRVSRSSLQKMKAMEATLSKASHIYPDCDAMIQKLRAMTHSAEEQVSSQMIQESFLRGLGGRTIPKGLHCLSMRLTAEYFSLEPEKRVFHYKRKLLSPRFYHFAIFSDNILACSVVVNSTVSTAKEPERMVFHVVTDSLNFPALSMWFLLNPPGKAAIKVESIENFHWLTTKYNVSLQKEVSVDSRYTSELNHLRFYLPDIFPYLNKIVFLDHDVVVQNDLSKLWSIDMRGKVNGAVQTCKDGEPSFRRMDMFVNFTDHTIANKFDAETCTWAFGMNVFDLGEWRRKNLTMVYHKYLCLAKSRPVLKEGSLPIGWLTFYKQTLGLHNQWHVLGLGHDPGVKREDIDQGFVLHFDGIRKPWLDIGFERYKDYWRKHVKYDHPYLQQCNVQE